MLRVFALGAVVWVGCRAPWGKDGGVPPLPDGGLRLVVSRAADGGFAFDRSLGAASYRYCSGLWRSLGRWVDGGRLEQLSINYIDPTSATGHRYVDYGPPSPSGDEWHGCQGDKQIETLVTHYEWSGQAIGPGDVAGPVTPGRYRFGVPGAVVDFDVPLSP